MGGLFKCLLYLVYLDTGFQGPAHVVVCVGALCAMSACVRTYVGALCAMSACVRAYMYVAPVGQ